MSDKYPPEILTEDEDNGTMPQCRDDLKDAIVGHRIESVTVVPGGFILILDNDTSVRVRSTDDCCAYTDVDQVITELGNIDHVITGVGTTDGFTKWHIYCDLGDVINLTVSWNPGNPFYYGYGLSVEVVD